MEFLEKLSKNLCIAQFKGLLLKLFDLAEENEWDEEILKALANFPDPLLVKVRQIRFHIVLFISNRN